MIRLRTIAAMLLGSAAFMAKADGGAYGLNRSTISGLSTRTGHCLL